MTRSFKQTNNIKRGSYSKVEQSTDATCIACESILKVTKELIAIVPSKVKVAHGVVPKISSVKSAVEKMASTYASTTAIGLQKSRVKYNTKPKRDVSSVFIIENSDVTFRNSSENNRNFAKWYPTKTLLYAFRTTRGHIHLEFESHQEFIEIEHTWKPHFIGCRTTCRRPRRK